MLHDTDLLPLLTVIIALVLFIGTFVLAIIKVDIPPIIITADGAALAAIFVTSSTRGNSPPPPTGGVK